VIRGSLEEVMHLSCEHANAKQSLVDAVNDMVLTSERIGISKGKSDACLMCDQVTGNWEMFIDYMKKQRAEDTTFLASDVALAALANINNIAAALQWGEETVELQKWPQPKIGRVAASAPGTSYSTAAVLSLIDKALEDHEQVDAGCLTEGLCNGQDFHATAVHDRAGQMLANLRKAVESGSTELKIEPDPESYPINDTDDDDDSAVLSGSIHSSDMCRYDDLGKSIIKLMATVGTERDGQCAVWDDRDILFGLSKVYPDLEMGKLAGVLTDLSDRGDVKYEPFRNSRSTCVLHDKHAVKKEGKNVAKLISDTLSSAQDKDGNLVVWTRNQLFFALDRSVPNERVFDDALKDLEDQGLVTVRTLAKNVCVSLFKNDMDRHALFLEGVGLSKANDSSEDESSILNASDEVLKIMRMQEDRLWRDYDLEGVLRANSRPMAMLEDDGSPGKLKKVLDTMIELCFVEFVPRESRPGIKEDRWMLADFGRTTSH